jgi:hypothetical protein
MQTRTDKGKSIRYQYESLVEFGDFCRDAPRKWRSKSSLDEVRDYQWDLGLGYDGAVLLAQNGWIEGAQRAQDALKVFTPATPQPDTAIDFYGFRPHVPRFCAGAPDNMIRHDNTPRMGTGRVVTLLVPIASMWWTRADAMANFGIGVAQYVNQMEVQGLRVEVLVGFAQSFGRLRVSHVWAVKNADQPLDLAVLAFAIGHPAALRRLGFAAIERSDAPEQANYGVPVDMEVSDIINASPGTVVVNGMVDPNECAKTPEKALAFISEQIEKAMEAQYAE